MPRSPGQALAPPGPLQGISRGTFPGQELIDGSDSLAHETGQTWPFSALPLETTPSPGTSNLFTSPSALNFQTGWHASLSKKKLSFCLNHLRGPPLENILFIPQFSRDGETSVSFICLSTVTQCVHTVGAE